MNSASGDKVVSFIYTDRDLTIKGNYFTDVYDVSLTEGWNAILANGKGDAGPLSAIFSAVIP